MKIKQQSSENYDILQGYIRCTATDTESFSYRSCSFFHFVHAASPLFSFLPKLAAILFRAVTRSARGRGGGEAPSSSRGVPLPIPAFHTFRCRLVICPRPPGMSARRVCRKPCPIYFITYTSPNDFSCRVVCVVGGANGRSAVFEYNQR